MVGVRQRLLRPWGGRGVTVTPQSHLMAQPHENLHHMRQMSGQNPVRVGGSPRAAPDYSEAVTLLFRPDSVLNGAALLTYSR